MDVPDATITTATTARLPGQSLLDGSSADPKALASHLSQMRRPSAASVG